MRSRRIHQLNARPPAPARAIAEPGSEFRVLLRRRIRRRCRAIDLDCEHHAPLCVGTDEDLPYVGPAETVALRGVAALDGFAVKGRFTPRFFANPERVGFHRRRFSRQLLAKEFRYRSHVA
jgi:hypothetical protein